MVYSDFNTPSANMNIPQRQIMSMIREQEQDLYRAEEEKTIREQNEYNRSAESYAEWVRDYIEEQAASSRNRMEFLDNTKKSFMSEAIYHLYEQSYDGKLNKRDKAIVKNLINSFVDEQGAGELINRFKYQNVLVAEMARIVQEAYDRVIESVSEDEPKPGTVKDLKLDNTIVDDFYKDLVELDSAEASNLIRTKVSDAMEEFIANNLQNKVDYMEIIDNAKQKIEDIKGSDPTGVLTDTEGPSGDQTVAPEESYIMTEAKRQINEMRRTRKKNVFHYLVEAITKQTFADDNLRAQYVHESSVDMDSIAHSAHLIYHMLEMVNTTEMVNSEYIREYVQSLVSEV